MSVPASGKGEKTEAGTYGLRSAMPRRSQIRRTAAPLRWSAVVSDDATRAAGRARASTSLTHQPSMTPHPGMMQHAPATLGFAGA